MSERGAERLISSVHHAAAEGYAAHAGTYVRGRPGYPPAIEGWLRGDLGLGAGKVALDLGAGTGKFCPRLLATGATVIAVEPVSAMLEQLARLHPGVEAKQGAAEHIPVAEASVDAVVCAQAFHWFATLQALHEIARVLKPGGTLGLIWNVRDEGREWVAALTRIMAPFEGDAPRHHTQHWRRLFPADGFSALREQYFSHEHSGPAEQVIVERVLSVSFIAALPPLGQARVAREVRELIGSTAELAGKAVVTFPYRTAAFSCTKLPGSLPSRALR